MTAQLVQDRVVVFVKRQVTILCVAHQQAATLEVPGYSFTEGVNDQVALHVNLDKMPELERETFTA